MDSLKYAQIELLVASSLRLFPSLKARPAGDSEAQILPFA